MSLFVNERHSGSAHITDDKRAQVNDAIIGGNYVFNAGSKLAITVSPTAGTVTIADGAFSFAGHTGGVTLTESASYTPPPSDTTYIKNIVAIRYNRDTSSEVEKYSLVVISSEAQATESAAEALDLTLASSEINDSSTTAEFPLWSFVATATSNTVPTQLFKTVYSLSALLGEVNSIKKRAESEASAREAADTALNSRVDALEKSVELIADSISGNYCAVTTSNYIGFVCMIQTEYGSDKLTPFFVPAVEGYYYRPFHVFTERTLGGFNVATYNSYVRVQANRIDYNTGDSATGMNVGSLKAIYGVK